MKKIFRELLESKSFRIDEKHGVLFGNQRGIPYFINIEDKYSALIFSVTNGEFPEQEKMKELVKQESKIRNVSVTGYRVEFIIKHGLTTKVTITNILESIDAAVSFMASNRYEPCCENTGKTGADDRLDGYILGGIPKILSETSFAELSSELSSKAHDLSIKKENVIGGIVGALLGSLAGVVAIVIIAQLGYVSVISGLIMGVTTVKGYSLLGGKLTKKGIAISGIIMLFMVYLGNNIDWALSISRELGMNFFESFGVVWEIIEYSQLKEVYYQNLGMLYLFTAIGAIPMIIVLVKDNNSKYTAYKI